MKNTVYTQKSLFEPSILLGSKIVLKKNRKIFIWQFQLQTVLFFYLMTNMVNAQGISTCTTLSDLATASGQTLKINGTTATFSSGNAGTAISTGQGSPAANYLNTAAIGTTNSSTVDNNLSSGWRDYIWIKIHFDTPIILQNPIRFQDIDGNAGTNAEMVTIIGQNGTTIVTPTYTAGSSLAGAATGTINDPAGIVLGNVTAYRQTGSYSTTDDDPRNILTADFGSQPVTDIYLMWGITGASGNTAAQYGTFSSPCLETVIPSQNPACTTPPYKVYEYNRPDPANVSNLPVQIIGATTTNVTLDERTTGTDLTYGGFNWKLIASNIVPDATNKMVLFGINVDFLYLLSIKKTFYECTRDTVKIR